MEVAPVVRRQGLFVSEVCSGRRAVEALGDVRGLARCGSGRRHVGFCFRLVKRRERIAARGGEKM